MTLSVAAGIAAALSAVGVVQALAGAVVTARFAKASRPRDAVLPPITVLKPLYGDEPLLELALGSLCRQKYQAFQVVFGAANAADPALRTVRALQARYSETDIAVVIDPTWHGPNLKVGNLINMLPAAKYDILAIADSDVHVRTDYLMRLAEALAEPGTGLVTTLYRGLPANQTMVAKLGAIQINHIFLPGALLARAMGRQDCLGATMVLRRETLERIGGLRSLVDHLADDQVLGRRVQALGLAVRLAHTVPATTVPETSIGALFRHELRWARTIRALVPGAFAASVLQYPAFWAMAALALSGGAAWSWVWFGAAWAMRASAALGVDGALAQFLPPRDGPEQGAGLAFRCPVWLLPLRDLISAMVMLASYAGRRVDWRGHAMFADTPAPTPSSLASPEGPTPR